VTEVSNVDITDYLDHNEAAFAADSDIGTLVGFNTGITVNYDGEGAILASVQVFVNGILATESIDGTPLDGDYFWGTSIEGTEDNPNGNAYAYTAIGVSTQDTGVLVEGVVQKIAGNYNTASLNNTDVLYWNGDKYPLSDGDKITIVYKKQ
jgi:hypothetical protein